MIEIKNLTKEYARFKAVDDISFKVREGEVFGFLGVNGAGKTTTLKMLVGILSPTSGTIRIGGHDLRKDPQKAKMMMGYVPDRPYMYPRLSGREFLYFIADIYGLSDKEADLRLDQLLEDYSLTPWQNEIIESYSHGMKQRLATCAALVHNPKILIFDEPMVGLDPHGAKLLKESIRSYASRGMSVLLSTHSLNVAEEIADRLTIIHQGSLIVTGTLDELKQVSGSSHDGLESLFLDVTTRPAAVRSAAMNGEGPKIAKAP
jgi:ABC-2 type transport system ATP-binding protein